MFLTKVVRTAGSFLFEVFAAGVLAGRRQVQRDWHVLVLRFEGRIAEAHGRGSPSGARLWGLRFRQLDFLLLGYFGQEERKETWYLATTVPLQGTEASGKQRRSSGRNAFTLSSAGVG